MLAIRVETLVRRSTLMSKAEQVVEVNKNARVSIFSHHLAPLFLTYEPHPLPS